MSNGKDPTAWAGINRKFTPIGRDNGESYFQANTRMNVVGELRRRHGMAASGLPQLGYGVAGLVTAWTANGPVIVQYSPTNILTGFNALKALWGDVVLPPIVGSNCVIMQTLSDAGTTSKNSQLNPPSNVCQGTILVIGSESSQGQGQGQGGNYGYQFQIECFGPLGLIITYNTACLVNQGTTFPLPNGTINVSYDITGGCSGGDQPGNWSIQITTP
jgi:hypothetical protein